MIKTDYTREELISICERAIVPQSKWENRDSEQAQAGVGRCWQLLKCGCEFEVLIGSKEQSTLLATDENVIWLQFYVHNFAWFENDEDSRPAKGYDIDSTGEPLNFYLPTEKALVNAKGKDWY